MCQMRRHNLLFREPGPSSVGEEHDEYESEADPNEKLSDDEEDEEGWDALFLRDDHDEDGRESDFDA